MGDHRKALKNYNYVTDRAPANPSLLNNRAWSKYVIGRNESALKDVDASLKARPNHPSALDTKAHILAALGRRDEALKTFEFMFKYADRDRVKKFQAALIDHGHLQGRADGSYGPSTRAALIACLNEGCCVLE